MKKLAQKEKITRWFCFGIINGRSQKKTTLFSFVTLPVEYDASKRALVWLKQKNMVSQEEYSGAEDALKWAARTYLVAAVGALASLLYWGLQVFGGRD